MQSSTNRRIVVQAGQRIEGDLSSKIINSKRAGGEAKVVKCLLSKLKALSSTLSYCKKKKKDIIYK
jgi:hypothetical protein